MTVTLNYQDYLILMREDFNYAFTITANAVERNKNTLSSLKQKSFFERFSKDQEIKDRTEFVEKSMTYLKDDFEKFLTLETARIKPLTVMLDLNCYDKLVKKCYNLDSLYRRYYVYN